MERKFIIVYLNKMFGVIARDAYTWAKNNGFNPNELNSETVLSEVSFWALFCDGLLDKVPVYFVREKQS
jgi:hypothetical protein